MDQSRRYPSKQNVTHVCVMPASAVQRAGLHILQGACLPFLLAVWTDLLTDACKEQQCTLVFTLSPDAPFSSYTPEDIVCFFSVSTCVCALPKLIPFSPKTLYSNIHMLAHALGAPRQRRRWRQARPARLHRVPIRRA